MSFSRIQPWLAPMKISFAEVMLPKPYIARLFSYLQPCRQKSLTLLGKVSLYGKIPYSKSPGLVVMERDSRSEGWGFESQHHILDGNFSHIFVAKNCNVCLKRQKINEKEAGVGPFFKNITVWRTSCVTGLDEQLLC